MSQAEFKDLLDRYCQGQCTPEEAAIVEKWYQNIHFGDISETELDEVQAHVWASVKPSRPIGRTAFYLKVAAVITLVAAACIGLFLSRPPAGETRHTAAATESPSNGMLQVTNNEKTSRNLALPDGSTVILEPASTLRFPRLFSASERTVELSGEAFFDVSEDRSRPFLVYSSEIITRVLGTSFRITAFDDSPEIVVAVETGRVSVSQNPGKEARKPTVLKDVILTPNQQLVYRREQESLLKQIVPVPAGIASDSSYYFMQFDGMPVTEIFTALEKNYGIDIQFDEDILKGCVLTTRMKEEGFHERIHVICKAINAEYNTVDGVVVIKSSGCH